MASRPTVFIDGEAGTTGLQIYQRLADRADLELVRIDPTKRKDAGERARLLNSVDVAVLCLPDEAAIESVSWVTNPRTKILDASTAHRTAAGWVYGFAELERGGRDRIAGASRVSNPGCYPTGFLALVRPLVETGLLGSDALLTVNAVSGYSGGGRQMMEQYEAAAAGGGGFPYGIYGLEFGHKHGAEMQCYGKLDKPPLFVPAVGQFDQGMLVQVPLRVGMMGGTGKGALSVSEIYRTLVEWYEGEQFVRVYPLGDTDYLRGGKFLDVMAANGTNEVQLFVFGDRSGDQVLLVARLDNLGKGASGAAVQNLNLMLGLPEAAGLT